MIRKSIYDKINNQNGAALITVLVVFLTLVVIVTTATQAALANYKRAVTSSETGSVIYVAEAGHNEILGEIKAFHQTKINSEENFDSNFGDKYVADFYTYLQETANRTKEDQTITINYDDVMGQSTYSEVVFSYEGKIASSGDSQFKIWSKGYVDDSSRIVESVFVIKLDEAEIEGDIYNPNANFIISGDLNPSNVVFPNTGSKIIGPIITNKPIYIEKNPVVSGPVVTNNTIEFEVAANFKEGRIITSSNIKADPKWSQFDVHTLMFKGNNNLDVKGNFNPVKIKYVFIPTKNVNNYFMNNGSFSQKFIDHIKATSVVYGYNPDGFNPFAETVIDTITNQPIPKNILKEIFGENPDNDKSIKYDYRDYFNANFVLNRLDKGEINVKDYMPTVVMPDAPDTNKMFPYGASKVTPVVFANKVLINADNEFDFGYNYWEWDHRALDLTSIEGIKEGQRHFKSIKLGGSYTNLTVDIKDKDIVLVTNKLELNGLLTVRGTGTLKIYVIGDKDPVSGSRIIKKDQLKISLSKLEQEYESNGRTVNKENPEQVQIIVYKTNPEVTVETLNKGNHYVSISFFSENLSLDSGGFFRGNFISANGKKIRIRNNGGGAGSQLIFAPEAEFSLEGNYFKGVVVAKNNNFSTSGLTLQFDSNLDESFVENILPEFIIPGQGSGSSSGTGGNRPRPIQNSSIREVNE